MDLADNVENGDDCREYAELQLFDCGVDLTRRANDTDRKIMFTQKRPNPMEEGQKGERRIWDFQNHGNKGSSTKSSPSGGWVVLRLTLGSERILSEGLIVVANKRLRRLPTWTRCLVRLSQEVEFYTLLAELIYIAVKQTVHVRCAGSGKRCRKSKSRSWMSHRSLMEFGSSGRSLTAERQSFYGSARFSVLGGNG